MFPFTAPDYGREDIKSVKNTVAFNCTSAMLLNTFKGLNLMIFAITPGVNWIFL